MVIIYCCYAGAHASVVAAAIHCGFLPMDRVPEADEFRRLAHYDQPHPDFVGRPYRMGRDEGGNPVFFMGLRGRRKEVSAAVGAMLAAGGVRESEYLMKDAFPLITFATKVGGLLSKGCGLKRVGRELTIWGIQSRYTDFVRMVNDVKHGLRHEFPLQAGNYPVRRE